MGVQPSRLDCLDSEARLGCAEAADDGAECLGRVSGRGQHATDDMGWIQYRQYIADELLSECCARS